MNFSHHEQQANAAISEAIKALQKAHQVSETAGYGSQVLAPLDEALRAALYALDTAEGRR